MKKYFTAIGLVRRYQELDGGIFVDDGDDNKLFKFSHVVNADNAVHAEEKVIDYYADKQPGDHFQIEEIEIFDFIE